jgi:hypothetical protein
MFLNLTRNLIAQAQPAQERISLKGTGFSPYIDPQITRGL